MFLLEVAILVLVSYKSRVGLASDAVNVGCTICHAKLSAKLPQGHSEDAGEKAADCLACHSEKGPTESLEAVMHIDHFSAAKFAGDCWSCHQLDEG